MRFWYLAFVVLASGCMFSGSASASRARVMVMGSADPFGVADRGSFFYDASDNMVYNPSYANDFKNWALVEKSNAPGTSAEGGFVTSIMNFTTGFYFNRGDAIRSLTGQSYSSQTSFRPLDFVFASDLGVKWGLGATFGNYRDTSTGTAITGNDITLRLGAQVFDAEPFVSIKLLGSQEVEGGAKTKSASMGAGLRYRWGEWSPILAFRQDKADIAGAQNTVTAVGGGLGRNAKLLEGTSLSYALSFWHASNTAGLKRDVLPINMAIESELISWFIGRVGLTYNLFDRTNGGSNVDSTTGRIGGSFHFGKANIDFAFGRATTVTGSETGAGAGYDPQLLGIGPDMFYAASVGYSW